MTDRYRDRLSEYLDGELGSEERRLVELHLRECEACARLLEELGAVVQRAATLPGRRPPPAVWEGIAARIEAGEDPPGRADDDVRSIGSGGIARRRIVFSLPQLAAAAVTLAALSAGVAWMAGARAPAGAAGGTAPGSGAVLAAAGAVDGGLGMAEYYAGSIAALERALFDPERPLPPETEARIRRALATIDAALEEARRALEEAPENPYLQEHVTDTMRRKSEFLRRAVKLAAQS